MSSFDNMRAKGRKKEQVMGGDYIMRNFVTRTPKPILSGW